jgi:hypothetical protein
MSIHFRCARCQSSFPVDSQLRDNPNQCPICKCTSLSAELGPTPRKKGQAPQTCVAAAPLRAPAPAPKTTRPDKPIQAARPIHRRIDWRIVGAAGAGAAFVVGCAILVIAARTPRTEPMITAAEEPVVVAVAEEPVKPEANKTEALPTPAPEPAAPAAPIVPVPPPVEEAKREVAKPALAPVAERKPLVFKHRFKRGDEELRRELLLVPEMGVTDIAASSRTALAEAPKNRKIEPGEMPDFKGLPMRMGIDCQVGEEEAKSLQALSRKLRTAIFTATPRDNIDTRADVDQLRGQLRGKEWQQPEAIATLTQMLMPEGRQLRLLLVEVLSQIPGSRASIALAQRAMFDLSQDVREAASPPSAIVRPNTIAPPWCTGCSIRGRPRRIMPPRRSSPSRIGKPFPSCSASFGNPIRAAPSAIPTVSRWCVRWCASTTWRTARCATLPRRTRMNWFAAECRRRRSRYRRRWNTTARRAASSCGPT